MKVKAKHNLNHNGLFHRGGEVFEIPDGEYEAVAEYVTVEDKPKRDEYISTVFPPAQGEEQPRRTNRRRKAEE